MTSPSRFSKSLRPSQHGKPERDADGNPICRWCRGPITKPGRRTLCSRACATEWLIRRNPTSVRWHLKQRDGGRCAGCGRDMVWLHDVWRMLREHLTYAEWQQLGRRLSGLHNCNRTWWEADHIKAVVEGGGQCGLDNYRTLCVRCHRQETKQLFARRKKSGV